MPIISGGKVIEGSGLDAPLLNAGAPTVTTYSGVAAKGSLLIDTTNGVLYICTDPTAGAVVWTKVGLQT